MHAGQLGLGNTNNRGDNSSEMGDNLPQHKFLELLYTLHV